MSVKQRVRPAVPPGREHRIGRVSDGRADVVGILERRRRQIGIAISAVLVLVAIVLVVQGGDGGDAPEAIDTAPHLVDVDDIAELEESLGHRLYWAGERPPDQLELTREADDSVYLRYLPPGVEAGDSRPQFLTIGTYPVAGAVEALQRTAAESRSSLQTGADGATILVNPSSRDSVYIARPDSDLQIEVYDPAGEALELIRSGAVRPVG
jgi:hypothetical protein